jgi:hypothetical protein
MHTGSTRDHQPDKASGRPSLRQARPGVKAGLAYSAFCGIEVIQRLKTRQSFAGLGKSGIHAQNAVVGHGGKPARFNLQNVKLFMLLKVICQGVTGEVEGEQVAGGQAFGVAINPSHVKKLGIAPPPQGKLMHGKRGRKRVPRLDKLGVWHLARLPAQSLDRQAKHGPCHLGLIKPYLKLKACRFLATDPENVGAEVLSLVALVVLSKLGADKAPDDLWSVGENERHSVELR